MRKIYLLFTTLLFLTSTQAQWTYSVSNSTNVAGTYTDLAATGTAITTNFAGAAMTYDDANSSVQNIGFNFTYNGTVFTQFVLNSNGFIKMGAAAPASAAIFYSTYNGTTGGAIASTETNLIYPMNHDLQGATSPEYRVLTSGVSPNRVCTIQFKNLKDKIGTAAQLQFANMQFQIKLYETSNIIEFVYGTWTASANVDAFKTFAVGVKGTAAANSVNITKGSTGAWSTSTFLAGNYTGNSHNIRNTILPDAGRTYRFTPAKPNDLSVAEIYTLGKIPLPQGVPHTISAAISNVGLNTLTNVTVTLNITGANTFTNTRILASIAPGATSVATFADFSPTVLGDNTITVSLPSDDQTSNNTKTVIQKANPNTWSYAYGPTPSGGIGFNGTTGDIAAKFTTSAATFLSQVSVNFTAGGEPFQIGVWDASGAVGAPGTLLWNSSTETTTTGVNVLPVTPALALPAGDFYVGVMQLGNFVSFAFQNETPIRAGTFFFQTATGGVWTDFAPTSPFRFMIEPKLILPKDASLTNFTVPTNISCLGNNETVTVSLANVGSTDIPVGAATVTLRTRGANTNNQTKTNTTLIASGSNEIITFTGVNFSAPGVNNDTVFVTYSGDVERENDTAKARNTTATTITAFPATENFETTFPVFSFVRDLTGDGQFWGVNTGSYTNADLSAPLAPHGGTKFIFFDSYNAPVGASDRLYSNCITLPPASAQGPCGGTLSFFMSHDTSFSTTLDSLYISISTDKGLNWNRLPVGYGRYDVTFINPGWRQETVDISAYAGQTFQVGFEGVSAFGNIIGLDDIVINTTCPIPVSLVDFTAKRSGKVNVLNWNTSQELNTKHFVIERSNDAANYTAIGRVNATGFSNTPHNYAFTDNDPVKGINYYRLRVVDVDNTGKFSKVRSVRNEGSADVAIYPNPVKDKMTVSINSDIADAAQITVTDVSGKIIYTANKIIAQGNNDVPVLLSNISGGSYVIKIKLSNDLIVKKFNKQ